MPDAHDGDASGYPPGADTDPNNPDSDADGQVDIRDVLLAQRHVLGLVTLSSAQIARGDLYPPGNGDGVLGLADLLLIIRLALV